MKHDPGFLQSIIDSPEDDALRLIYADWLDDHGDPDQAEFLRVQIELARQAEDDEDRPQLLGREAYLLARHCKEWGRPVRGVVQRWEFRRGCLEGITLPLGQFLGQAEQLLRLAPIRHVHLTEVEIHLMRDLSACPQPRQVSEITLRMADSIGYLPGPLVFSPHLEGLQVLRFRSRAICGTELQMLGALSDLETLDLQVNYGFPVRFPFPQGNRWPRLRRLHLSSGTYLPDLVQGVARQLEVLDLARCGVTLEQLLAILPISPSLPLRELHLGGNRELGGLSADHFALFAKRLPQNLRVLDLRGCFLGGVTAVTLARNQNLALLTHLDVGFNPHGRSWLQALVASPHLGQLTHLGVAHLAVEWMGSLSWVDLLDSPNLPRLAALDLRRNDLEARAAEALASSSLPGRLYRLDLRHNRLGDAGARALLAANWPRLAWLDLRDNGLTPNAKERLRQRFGYTVHY